MSIADLFRRLWRRRTEWPQDSNLAVSALPDPIAGRLQSVLDAADDGLIACDAEASLTLLNPAAAALLEVEPVRLGETASWPDKATLLSLTLRRAMDEGYASVELESERAGRILQLEGRANCMFTADGQVDGAVMVLRDMTRLREVAAARTDDWAALAHDLKTPLNSMSGFTSLLLQEAVGPLNTLQRDFLRTIEQEGQRLLQAVQGFLEDAQAGGAGERLNREHLRLASVIEETVDRVRPLALRKSVVIDVDVPAGLPSAEADHERVGLVLMNLLDNAISFSQKGGRIEVATRARDGELEVSVKDEGAGIPDDALPLVFNRFYRAANQPTEDRPGVGLGLSICKQVVERHGGRIWAENVSGGGARFVFTLPVAMHSSPRQALGAAL